MDNRISIAAEIAREEDTPATAVSSIAAQIKAEEDRQQQIDAKLAEDQNARVSPALQAQALPLAKANGLPIDTARRNVEQLRADAAKPELDQAKTLAPSYGKVLQDEAHGPIAQSAVAEMPWFERVMRSYGQAFEGGFEDLEASDIGYRRMQGTATPQDINRLKELNAAQKQRTDFRLDPVTGFFQSPVASAPATATTFARTWDEVLLGAGTGAVAAGGAGLVSGPGAGVAAVGGAVTGAGIGLRVGLVKESYEQLAGDAYNQALDTLDENGNPLDENTAYSVAMFAGGVGAVAELLPFEKALDTMPFLKGLVGKEGARRLAGLAVQNPAVRASLSRIGRVLKVGGAEAFTEVLQEALTLEGLIAAGGVTDGDGRVLADQRLERYGQAAIGGFAGGSTLGAGGEAATAVAEKVASMRLKKAEAKQQALIELGDKIRGSKVNALSPETVIAHAQQIDADGNGPQMSAPAEKLVELFQSEGLTAEQVQARFPGLAQALDEAAQGNAEVPLNAATVVKLAQLEGFSGITGDIRTAPGELTLNEAKARETEFDQMIEGVSAEEQKAAVRASVESELVTQFTAAGMDPKVAATNARLHATVMSRFAEGSGKTLDQLMKERQLQVTSGQDMAAADPSATLLQKDVLARTPELQDGIRRLQAGEITREDYAALVNKYKPVLPYQAVPTPATVEAMQGALTSDKLSKIGAPDQLKAGHQVGLRLDIPAYARHGTWVVSVHEQKAGFGAGAAIGYTGVARASNVDLGVVENAAAAIAGGKPKGTIATMKGSWVPTTPEQAKADADAALNDPAWRQIGMDPERHAYFYDRDTMQPITAAEEVIQIGPLVLGKNVTYGDSETFLFQSEAPAADATPAGGLTDKGQITVDALRDAVVIPIFADLTDAGRVYDKLDGLPLTPTRYFGGPNFPWLKQYRDANIVWAFNKQQVITKLRNHVRNIKEKAKAEGRPNQRVVITVLAMKDDAHTSNEMTINALLRTLDAVVAAGRFPQEVLAEAKAFIVGQNTKKEDGYKELKTFPGFDDAKKLHDWIRGATFTGRKALAKEMQSAKFEQFPGMFPVSRVIREAVDPDYRATQVGDALLAFEIDPDDEKLIIDFDDPASGVERHPSYRYGMRGKLLGSFKTHIPMEVLYKDLLPKVIARSNPGSAPKFLMERLSNGGKLSAKGNGAKTSFKLPMNNVTEKTLSVSATIKDKASGEDVPTDLGPFTVVEETYTSKSGDEKESFFLKFETAPPKGVSILATNQPDGQTITQDVIDHSNVIEGLHDYRIAQAMTAALSGQWRTNDIDGTKGGVIPVEFERALAENEAAVTLTKYTRDDVKKGKQDGSLRVFQLGTAKVEEGGLSTWFAIKKGLDYRQEYPGSVTDQLVADGVLTENETALVGVANNELGVKGMLTFQVLKAIEEGVTVLDCFKVKSAKKPFGLLPSLYATMGFQEVGAIPFDPQYFDTQQLADLKAVWTGQGWNEADGYPDVAIMKYRGSDAVRSEATRRFILEGQDGLGLGDLQQPAEFQTAQRRVLEGVAADDGRGGRAGEGDGRADPGSFRDRAGGLAGESRAYVRNVLAADQRATDALKLPPDLINRIRERFPDLDPAKAPSPGPSSSEGTTTLYQSDLSFYDPSLKPLIKARDVKAVAIRTVDQLLQIADGMKTWRDWYARYEQVLIDFLGSPEEAQLFQDILSATSQAASVKANVGLAIRAYDLMKSGQPFTGYLPAVVGNLNRIREKQAVQGRKIGQYGEASNGNTDAIAVDRHIAMVIFGVKAPSPKQIEEAKGMIREISQRLGWAPREVQAALWAGNQILLGTPEENIGSYDAVLLKKGEPLKQLFRDIQSRNGDVRGTGGSAAPVGAAAGGTAEGQAVEGQQRLDQTAQSTTSFARGSISFTAARDKFTVTLTGKADLSTFQHEAAHYYLEVLQALVEEGSASPQMVEDLAAIKKWMGLAPGNKAGPPAKLDRRQHEQFARGWEAYLMEGRSPSADLQGVFNRFRAWMVFVYKRLTALDVQLTDEVRGVFDRLVASDQEIAEARTNVGWTKPLPKEALFLTDDEYDRYVEAWNKANEEQQRAVDARLMLEAANEAKEQWKEERRKLFEEEKAKLGQTRGHRAWKLLTEGTGLGEAAPGRTTLKIDPATVPSEWRRDTTGMTEEGGLPLDAVAEILGFNSGEEMISTIAGAKFAERDLPRQVQKMMEERHGALDPAALADIAMQAVHSDKTQEVLLSEYRAMASKAGLGAAPSGMTKWMAAQAQQKVLGLTRRQLDPMRWRRAEMQAAEKSATAAAKGDATKAAVHKRQQMMAAAMYRASIAADKRVDTIRNKLMPFTKNDRRAKLGKAGDLYLDGIDQILEDIQLKPMSAASVQKLDRLQKLVEEADKNGEPLVLPDKLRAMLGKKNFQDMTLEELEGVHDAVMNIWHLAKLKNELKARAEKRELEEALTEMEANAQAALGDPKVTVLFTKGWTDKAAATMRSFRAGLTKMEFLFGWLDGKPDGGLMHRLIYQPIADANKAKFDILQRFHETIIERMRNMPNEQKARWESKRTFMGNPTANGATIISAALNLGNLGNKQKLLEGYGWNEQRLMAEINAFMTKADWDFVQHVWDEIDTLWPKIEATTKAATGLAPEKVVASPIVTPFGTYAGGYYPVVYDPEQTEQQFKNQQESAGLFTNNYARPTLGDGFTKARVQYAAPILLKLDVISRHLAEVVHYVTHYEAVTQADKITRHPRFQAVVKGHMGNEFYRTIRPWLQDVARDQDTPAITNQEPFAKAMRHLRGGVSIAAMGYNIFSGVKQLIGVVQSLDAIGPKYWLSGLSKAWLSPNAIANWKFAFNESQELRPLVTQLDRDIKMINDAYAMEGTLNMPAKVASWAFKHIGWLQAAVNVATWHGAYEQELAANNGDHERAVMHADAVVRMTQSAGAVKDLSPIQRGTEINRAVSMFYSWFNVLYNRLEDIARQTKSIRDVPKAAARVAILVMMSSMIEEAGRRAWEAVVDNYEDDEEEAGYILSVLLKSADTAIGAIPLGRVFISAEAAAGGMTPDLVPVAGVVDSYWRTARAAYDLVAEGEAPSRSEVKAAVRTVSIIGGVPLSGPYNFLDEMFGETVFGEGKKTKP